MENNLINNVQELNRAFELPELSVEAQRSLSWIVSRFTKSLQDYNRYRFVRKPIPIKKLLTSYENRLRIQMQIKELQKYKAFISKSNPYFILQQKATRINLDYIQLGMSYLDRLPKIKSDKNFFEKAIDFITPKVKLEKPLMPDTSPVASFLPLEKSKEAYNKTVDIFSQKELAYDVNKISPDTWEAMKQIFYYQQLTYHILNNVNDLSNTWNQKASAGIIQVEKQIKDLEQQEVEAEKELKSAYKEAFNVKVKTFEITDDFVYVGQPHTMDYPHVKSFADNLPVSMFLDSKQELINIKADITAQELDNLYADSWESKKYLHWRDFAEKISLPTLVDSQCREVIEKEDPKCREIFTQKYIGCKVLEHLANSENPYSDLWQIYKGDEDRLFEFISEYGIREKFVSIYNRDVVSESEFINDFYQSHPEATKEVAETVFHKELDQQRQIEREWQKDISSVLQYVKENYEIQNKLSGVRIFSNNGEYHIKANINGEEQLSMKLTPVDMELYKNSMDNHILKLELAEKYYSEQLKEEQTVNQGIKR